MAFRSVITSSLFLGLGSFLIGSHLETLLLTIKSMTISTSSWCSDNKAANSSASQAGNISDNVCNCEDAADLLGLAAAFFCWPLWFFRCDIM